MNKLYPYFLWIPLTIFYNYLMCWSSVHYSGKNYLSMYVFMTAVSFIPTWSLAAYFSHNLVFDGLIFDSTLVITSPILFWFLGQGHDFPWVAWLGVALTIVGLTITRYATAT